MITYVARERLDSLSGVNLLLEVALLEDTPKAPKTPTASPLRPDATPSIVLPPTPSTTSPPPTVKKIHQVKRSLALTPAAPSTAPPPPKTPPVHTPATPVITASGRLRVTTYQTIRRDEYLPQVLSCHIYNITGTYVDRANNTDFSCQTLGCTPKKRPQ